MKYVVSYWPDFENAAPRGRQQKQFDTQAEAVRYIMLLDPHFRVHIDERAAKEE